MSVLAKFAPQSHSAFSPSLAAPPSDNSFAESLMRLLDRVDYRLANSTEAREAIFRLRYQAYLREGAIEPNPSQSFSDHYDEMANVDVFGIYVDDELASSIRIHLVSKDHLCSPSVDTFRDILQPEIDAGKTILDPSRFVTDEKLSRLYRGLPYVTTRLPWLAARFLGAQHLLAAVRLEHQAFYRRVFDHRMICGPRAYPGLTKPLSLMTTCPSAVEEDVHRRYPHLRSTFNERRLLFESGQSQSSSGSIQSRATLSPELDAAGA
jgi:hypothetical protein